MKKFLILLLLAAATARAQFAVDTYRIQQTTTVGPPSTFAMRDISPPVNASVAIGSEWDGSVNRPVLIQFGSNLSYNTSTNTLNVSGVQSDIAAGTTSQYYRGDKTWASWINADWSAGSGGAQILNKPTTLSGYGITDAQPLNSNLTSIAALTTTSFGRSLLTQADAAAVRSLIGAGTGSGNGTVTSVGVSSTDFSVSGSPVTASGSITLNLNTTGVSAGTYTGVTVNTKGQVTAGTNPSVTNNPSRTIVTNPAAANGWQVSSARPVTVSYTVTITATASGLLAGASSGYVVLEICPTNSSTAGDWIEIARVTNGQSINSILTLSSTQPVGAPLCGTVPSGYYTRLRSVNVTGTPSYNLTTGQETIW